MSAAAESMDRLSWFAGNCGGELQAADVPVLRVTTDTRALRPGDLFVALRGERFDGHDFAPAAVAAGAVAVLTDRSLDPAIPQLRVGDTLLALQRLAQAWRARFQLPVVAVTGSNGKTTTKQLLAAVYADRGAVLATRGNLNNHIGLPLTLLELRASHRTAVIEMGANHPGEIALLTRLTCPDVGVITQAGDAHLEGFGSRAGVARAKGELFEGLSDAGVAVINADDAYAPLWKNLARGRQIRFGIEAAAEVRASALQPQQTGTDFRLEMSGASAAVHLPLPGLHNVMNALAAAACGYALGLDVRAIAAGLARVESAQGRVVWKTTAQGARLIDDSYNANPTSMQAGLALLAQQPGQRWAVLGGMAELGPAAAQLHEDCGRAARSLGLDRLLLLGPAGEHYARGWGAGAERFEQLQDLVRTLAADAGTGVSLLVKGSRSAGMERVVAALCGESSMGAQH